MSTTCPRCGAELSANVTYCTACADTSVWRAAPSEHKESATAQDFVPLVVPPYRQSQFKQVARRWRRLWWRASHRLSY